MLVLLSNRCSLHIVKRTLRVHHLATKVEPRVGTAALFETSFASEDHAYPDPIVTTRSALCEIDGPRTGTVSSSKKRSGMRLTQTSTALPLPGANPTVSADLVESSRTSPGLSGAEGRVVDPSGHQAGGGAVVGFEGPAAQGMRPSHAQPPAAVLEPPQHLDRETRRLAAAAGRAEAAIASDPRLLAMPPGRLALQQDLTNARSCAEVLALCTEDEVSCMDSVNFATAVHRLARLAGSVHERSLVTAHPRFVELVAALSQKLPELNVQGLVNVLWAFVQLQHFPEWLPKLLSSCLKRCLEFSARDLSATLSCLAKTRSLEKSAEAGHLKTAVLDAFRHRVGELETPTDLVCAAAALSRLGIREEEVFARIAEQAVTMMDSFDTSDITSILWAFANINFAHTGMFNCIRQVLQQQVEQCAPRELVQIAWAFSRVKQADEELLVEVFAPVIRAKMLEFDAPRDLCTLAWAFSHAGVTDDALFNDLAHVLTAKVKLMNAHDVASVVVAFSSIEYAHRRLFRALQKHTRAIANTFSPLQLARTIYGFGVAGVDDEPLFRTLSERALKRHHLLHAKNVVEIVIGLAEAEYTPPKIIGGLLASHEELIRWLGAEDGIQLLHALSRMPRAILKDACPEQLVPGLTDLIRRRIQGWWRLRPLDMADLLEAMQALRVYDMLILESVCKQLPRALQDPACDPSLVLRLWGGLAELPLQARCVVKARLHRGEKIANILEQRLTDAVASLAGADSRTKTLLMYSCARLGYDGDIARQLSDNLLGCMDGNGGQFERSEAWTALLVWSLAEMGWEEDFARRCAEEFVSQRYAQAAYLGSTGQVTTHSLLQLAWSLVALGMRCDSRLVSELYDRLEGKTWLEPDVLHLLRPVALDCALRAGLDVEASGSPSARVQQQPELSWLTGLLLQPRSVSYVRERPHDQWISKALVKSRVPHEAHFTVGGTHLVSAALPERRKALVVLCAEELAVPSWAPLGPAALRERQLQELGWRCKYFSLPEVKGAETEDRLPDLLSNALAELESGELGRAPPVLQEEQLPK